MKAIAITTMLAAACCIPWTLGVIADDDTRVAFTSCEFQVRIGG